MKINEIIQDDELFDIIEYPAIRAIDKAYDDINNISSGFHHPAAAFNQDIISEISDLVREVANADLSKFPKWRARLDKIIEWVGL